MSFILPDGSEANYLALAFIVIVGGALVISLLEVYIQLTRSGVVKRRPPRLLLLLLATTAPPQIVALWRALKEIARQLLRPVVTYRIPILGTILILTPWLSSAQIHESYRAELADALAHSNLTRYMQFHVSLIIILLNISIYMAGATRYILSHLNGYRPVEATVVFLAPAVYLAVASLLFGSVVFSEPYREYHSQFWQSGIPFTDHFSLYPGPALTVYFLVLLTPLILLSTLGPYVLYMKNGKLPHRQVTFSTILAMIFAIGYILWGLTSSILAGDISPREHFFTRAILGIGAAQSNPISEIFYSLSLWTAGLFFLTSRIRFPALELAVVAALVWSYLDWNDNHRIRMQASGHITKDIGGSFANWMAGRRDLKAFQNADYYPVYVVAAEGGGIYAAVHAAVVLGRLQDQNPKFGEHVFAISAVSGGSLGAAVFNSLITDAELCTGEVCFSGSRNAFEQRAIAVLSHDFLTPLLHMALRTDLLQRILPRPIEKFDRALALEKSFERAWTSVETSSHPLRDGVLQSAQEAKAPFLLLNATEADTGNRVVISALSMERSVDLSARPAMKGLLDVVPGKDLALSTAVGLSARFPIVTPAGWYELEQGDHILKRRVVDGGYFDNSGIETAIDVIRAIEPLKTDLAKRLGVRHIRIILISISSHEIDEEIDSGRHGFGETLTPYRAMINSWRARTSLTVANAAELLEPQQGPSRIRKLVLYPDKEGLPLGWQLSTMTIAKIANWAGGNGECGLARSNSLRHDLRVRSDCAFQDILKDLGGSNVAK